MAEARLVVINISGQKNEGINDGRDDFDGTEQSLPAGTPGPVGKSSNDTHIHIDMCPTMP